MEMQQQQIAAQNQPKQSFDPEAEKMKAEIDMQKQQAKQEADMQKIEAQSRAKQDDYASQKLADLRHEVIMKQLSGGDSQEKPRPDGSNNK